MMCSSYRNNKQTNKQTELFIWANQGH